MSINRNGIYAAGLRPEKNICININFTVNKKGKSVDIRYRVSFFCVFSKLPLLNLGDIVYNVGVYAVWNSKTFFTDR